MAKLNALQEQLLKAGLAKKSKAAEVAREQAKARQGKAPPTAPEAQADAERAREEKVERDRALAAAQRAEANAKALRAQARQIIDDKNVPAGGDVDYRFSVDGVIRSVLVTDALRRDLAAGRLMIVRRGDGFALLPRPAGEKVRDRAPEWVVLDNRAESDTAPPTINAEDAAYYAQFTVPDDLDW